MGELKSDFMVTWMAKYDQTIDGVKYHLAGTHGPLIVGGDTGSPRTRIKWANTFSHGPVEVTGTLNYLSGYSLEDPSYGVTDCLTALQFGSAASAYRARPRCPRASAAGSARSSPSTSKAVRVQQEPDVQCVRPEPVQPGRAARLGDVRRRAAPYNPSLHQQGAIGRYMTIGASYKF